MFCIFVTKKWIFKVKLKNGNEIKFNGNFSSYFFIVLLNYEFPIVLNVKVARLHYIVHKRPLVESHKSPFFRVQLILFIAPCSMSLHWSQTFISQTLKLTMNRNRKKCRNWKGARYRSQIDDQYKKIKQPTMEWFSNVLVFPRRLTFWYVILV